MAIKNNKKRKDEDVKAKKPKTTAEIPFDIDPDLIAPARGLR